MSDKISLVILAAGEGKRLRLNCPKPLAPLAGKKLIDFPVEASLGFLKDNNLTGKITLVLGHGIDLIKAHPKSEDSKIQYATQEKQLGTADAVRSYLQSYGESDQSDYTFVLCSDTPMISKKDLLKLYETIREKDFDAIAATFTAKNPFGYGRIIQTSKGFHIVEEKDADKEIKEIEEVNSGLYIFKSSFLKNEISSISNNNKSSEFYLTDIFSDDKNVKSLLFEDESTFLGVNDLHQLQKAERIIKKKHMNELVENGVRFIDINHSYVDVSVEVGEGTCVYPNVFLEGKTVIGKNCIIEPGAIIRSSTLQDEVHIKAYSHLEDSIVKSMAVIGPYGRLRPGSDIGEGSKIGNFVEIKKSKLHQGVKVSHLSYVGDAEIGDETNIGCGFITCNYDGKNKHKTTIGKNTFIGSDSQTVAPVEIGNDCFVASASTINQSMPDGSFAISRTRQETKPGMAKKFLKK